MWLSFALVSLFFETKGDFHDLGEGAKFGFDNSCL